MKEQKQIDIRQQPRLSLARTVKLTLHGIRYRLFRSLVTVIVITVAVAFLMNIVGESLVTRSVGRRVAAALRSGRLVDVWVSRLAGSGSRFDLLRESAAASTGDDRYREDQQLAGWDEATMADFHAQARVANRYLDFFGKLPYGQHRRLLHQATGLDVFPRLATADGQERFRRELAQMPSLQLPTSLDALFAFATAWEAVDGRLSQLQAARERAVATVRAGSDTPPLLSLVDADGAFGERLRAAGFVLPPEQGKAVASQARDRLDRQFLQASLVEPALQMRNPIGARLRTNPRDIQPESLWRLLADADEAAWFATRLQERLATAPPATRTKLASQGYRTDHLDGERLRVLARQHRLQQSLQAASRSGTAGGGGLLGLGERLSWLILVSLIVCTVGIANAMLMTVTERFREIATLKCLGALDGFIMLMFVTEASLLGFIGGLVGAIAGAVIATLRMLGRYGDLLGGALPWAELLLAILVATLTGILLAAVAAVYPSFKAARLAPMEAMRIE